MSRLRVAIVLFSLTILIACGQESKSDTAEESKQSEALEAKPPATDLPSPNPTPAPGAAPGAAPAQKLAADSHCSAICTRSTALGCPAAANCEAMCRESMAGETCKAEMQAVNECLIAQPPANWECTDDGVAAIKDGFCEAEQVAYAKCMNLGGG